MDDPFLVTTQKTLHRRLIEEIEEDYRTRTPDTGAYGYTARPPLGPEAFERFWRELRHARAGTLEPPRDARNVLRFGSTRSARNRQATLTGYLARLAMAVLGGVSLVAPMLVMVLHPSLVTSLVTSCVFVFAFSVVVSSFLEKPFDVLSATAAYAAVLVVFVGTSIGGGGAGSTATTG